MSSKFLSISHLLRPAALASGSVGSIEAGDSGTRKRYSAVHNQRQDLFCTAICQRIRQPYAQVRGGPVNSLATTFPLPLQMPNWQALSADFAWANNRGSAGRPTGLRES